MSGAYAHEKDTGERIDVLEYEPGAWALYGKKRYCTVGIVARWGGTCDSKIAVMEGSDVSISWTPGNPVDWQGAWDRYGFH